MCRVLKGQFERNILSVIVLITILSIVGMFIFKTVSHAEVQPVEYSYTSVLIKSGDTISKIASDYLSQTNLTHTEFVNEIMRINFLPNDNITSGSYIIVPLII